MAGDGLRKEVRRKLYRSAGRMARGVSDGRRQRFIFEMLIGLVLGALTSYQDCAGYWTRGEQCPCRRKAVEPSPGQQTLVHAAGNRRIAERLGRDGG